MIKNKSLEIPFISGLEAMDFQTLEKIMDEKAAKFNIDCVNWPEEYPYRPFAGGMIARSESHICVMYCVRGQDLRAKALEDQGKVWEDSCCEMFISHPTDGTYYNFELNCIGTLLVAKRTGRHDPSNLSPEQMSRIKRFTSLPRKEYDVEGEVFSWTSGLCIPMDLIGIDSENLPRSVRANFFKCADGTPHIHFLSWNPIGTPSPDFHRPAFFGELFF